jgi:diketogulonate reductase-like aldo/keto reductase
VNFEPSVPLADGRLLPIVGLGTWNVTGGDVAPAVQAAVACGYRHIDTAYGYGNEAEIGQALHETGIDRGEMFLTSKIPPRRIGHEEETLVNSLRGLRTDYLDLWLIHALRGVAGDAEHQPVLRHPHPLTCSSSSGRGASTSGMLLTGLHHALRRRVRPG